MKKTRRVSRRNWRVLHAISCIVVGWNHAAMQNVYSGCYTMAEVLGMTED